MIRHAWLPLALFISCLLADCGKKKVETSQVNLLNEAALNRGVDPCVDFFEFSCGSWIRNTPFPPGYSTLSLGDKLIEDKNFEILKSELERNAARRVGAGENQRKLGDYYAACLDEGKAEAATRSLLPAEVAIVERLTTKSELPLLLAELHTKGVDGFFSFGADQDYRDATKMIGIADRGGIGLPDRDYYLKDDEEMRSLRSKYRAHLGRMLEIYGVPAGDAQADADSVMALETELASHMLSIAQRRVPENIYHKVNRIGLQNIAPRFSWDNYFLALGVPHVQEISVVEPEYYRHLDGIIDRLSVETIKAYLRWEVITAHASKQGKTLFDENFDFYGKTLKGLTEPRPRWKRCIDTVGGALGEALGEAYVQVAFAGDSKQKATEMFEKIRFELEKNFDSLGWMDTATRGKAKHKLGLVNKKFGYPDKWRDYSALEVDRSSLYANEMRSARFRLQFQLNKIGHPVVREEWSVPPQEINALYNTSLNEIIFPAAILQFPYFHANATVAANYGAIGATVGHEITHGFDDEGRKFDGFGNLSEWWSSPVSSQFTERADCLVKQFDKYTVAGGVHLKGDQTLGENIADLGGLKLAYRAYREMRKNAAPEAAVFGFNENQQFFVSYAQSWCSKYTDKEERYRAQNDVHAHQKYRVNGVVANIPEFAEAFACPPGKPLAPANRCAIW